MTDTNKLDQRLREAFANEQSPMRVRRMWQNIETADLSPQKTGYFAVCNWWRIGVIAVGAGALIILAIYILRSNNSQVESGPLMLAEGMPIDTVLIAKAHTKRFFSDGSQIDLTAGTTLSLSENSGESVGFAISEGEARFNVHKGGPRVWQVDCRGVLITVVGTEFICRAEPEKVSVSVRRGIVMVESGNIAAGQKKLVAGERIDVAMGSEFPNRSVPQASDRLDTRTVESPSEVPARRISKIPLSSETPGWKVRAAEGDFNGAFDRLGAESMRALAGRATNVDELFQLADVARLSGHPVEAIAPLQTIVTRFSDNARAGLAAYTLGRLYLEQLSMPVEAAKLFDQALSLGLPEVLEETAMMKRALSLMKFSREDGTHLASEYLTRYPNGRYRKKAEQIVKGEIINDVDARLQSR